MAFPYGYVRGPRSIQPRAVKSGVTIAQGDMLKITSGYVEPIAAGDVPIGVAVGEVRVAGTVDGAYTIGVDVSETAEYRYPVTSGTLDVTDQSEKCDTNGPAAVALTSTDGCLLIKQIDTINTQVIVSLLLAPAGV